MRETRELRKQLSGEEAAPYLGVARVLLGQLKNRMSFGALLQGSHTWRLPDGVTIKVRSIFGQDRIDIFKPVPSLSIAGVDYENVPPVPADEIFVPEIGVVQPIEPSDLVAPSLVACGQYNVLSGVSLIPRPYRWTPGAGIVDLEMPPAATEASTVGISGDGRFIAGNAAIAGASYAVVWRGLTPTVIAPGVAFGASLGGTDVGYITVSPNSIYRWSENSGSVLVAGPANLTFPDVPKMSRDGRYIVSTMNTSPNRQARVWASDGQVFNAPLIGYRGLDVSDTGVVVLHRASNDAALWDIHTNAVVTMPGFLFPNSISPDGRNVVGVWVDDSSAAAWRDHQGVITVLDPGPQTFVGSDSKCVDAFNGAIVIGGYAALLGQPDNTAPSVNDAIWRVQSGVPILERIPPSPNSYAGDGGFITAISIPRMRISDDGAGELVVESF